MDRIRALSVRAPWAGRIASGVKDLEIRSRRTHYRGRLAICQSGGGGVVALVDLVDCRRFVAEDSARSGGVWTKFPVTHTHYAWELRLDERVSSEKIKGQLGLYWIDAGKIRPYDAGEHHTARADDLLHVRRAARGEMFA